MAAKMQMSKLLQEIRGFAELSNRRPQPRSPGLFFANIRSHLLQGASARHKLSIRIDSQDFSDLPCQVKIVHLKQCPSPAARPAHSD